MWAVNTCASHRSAQHYSSDSFQKRSCSISNFFFFKVNKLNIISSYWNYSLQSATRCSITGQWKCMFVLTHLWSPLFLLVWLQFQIALFSWTSGRVRRRGFWCQSHGKSWVVRREIAGPPRYWNPRPAPADPVEETRLQASGETMEAYRERQRHRWLMGEGRDKMG